MTNPSRLAAELQSVALALRLGGLDGLRSGQVKTSAMLCPQCQADTPSTEAFEVFGVVLCAECATALYDPGDGFPTTENET